MSNSNGNEVEAKVSGYAGQYIERGKCQLSDKRSVGNLQRPRRKQGSDQNDQTLSDEGSISRQNAETGTEEPVSLCQEPYEAHEGRKQTEKHSFSEAKATASTESLLKQHKEGVLQPSSKQRGIKLSTAVKRDPKCADRRRGRISAVNKNVKEIDAVSGCEGATSLLLSRNCLRSLAGVENFPRVSALSLASNLVDDVGEIERINIACGGLRSLFLSGNPICAQPCWRERVILALPGLEELDGERITEQERRRAPGAVRGDSCMLEAAVTNATSVLVLERARKIQRLHTDLRHRMRVPASRMSSPTGIDARFLLRCVETESLLGEAVVTNIRAAVRKEVAAMTRRVPDSKNKSTADLRETAYSALLHAQQGLLARLCADIEEERACEQQKELSYYWMAGTTEVNNVVTERYGEELHSRGGEVSNTSQKQSSHDEGRRLEGAEHGALIVPEQREREGVLVEAEAELERAVGKLEELERENRDLQAANEALKGALSGRAAEAESERQEREQAEQRASELEKDMEGKWEKALEEVEATDKSRESMRQEADELRRERDRLQYELSQCQRRLQTVSELERRRETAEYHGERRVVVSAFNAWRSHVAFVKETEVPPEDADAAVQALEALQFAHLLGQWRAKALLLGCCRRASWRHSRRCALAALVSWRNGRQQRWLTAEKRNRILASDGECLRGWVISKWREEAAGLGDSRKSKGAICERCKARCFDSWQALCKEEAGKRRLALVRSFCAWRRLVAEERVRVGHELERTFTLLKGECASAELDRFRERVASMCHQRSSRELLRRALHSWRGCQADIGRRVQEAARKASGAAEEVSKAQRIATEQRKAAGEREELLRQAKEARHSLHSLEHRLHSVGASVPAP